jgi:hypothetical protein
MLADNTHGRKGMTAWHRLDRPVDLIHRLGLTSFAVGVKLPDEWLDHAIASSLFIFLFRRS